MIRAGGILQLLLGNIGRPGGGILAMRGHSSIQGSTDVGTLYDVLPGYLPQPAADGVHDTLDSYVAHDGMATGYWSHFRETSSACSRRGTGTPPGRRTISGTTGCRGSSAITRNCRPSTACPGAS